MTLQQLQYVIAIVEHGSISETAKQLYVAQPTLSSAVRTLEEEFGILIFHRSARGIALTEDGRGAPFPPSTMPLLSMPLYS